MKDSFNIPLYYFILHLICIFFVIFTISSLSALIRAISSLSLHIGFFILISSLSIFCFVHSIFLFPSFLIFICSFLPSFYKLHFLYITCISLSFLPTARLSPPPPPTHTHTLVFLSLPTFTPVSPPPRPFVQAGRCLVQPAPISNPTFPRAAYSTTWWWKR
jgi:hypothetical protein